MRRVSRMIACVVLIGAFIAAIPSSANAKPQKRGKHQQVVAASGTQVSVQVVFARRDVQLIREYYAPRHRSLPPGLQKKYQRTGQLPPGWQKKFDPFPFALERQLVVLPSGYRRGVIDGHAVIVNPRTGTIFDVAVLF